MVYRPHWQKISRTPMFVKKLEDRFAMSEFQTALIFDLKFNNINYPGVRKRSRMEKFGHLPLTEKFFFFR